MRIVIFTLFPAMFTGAFGASIVARARERGQVALELRDFREMALDRHRTVDDYPYGGGAGMVLRPEPLFAAVEAAALPPNTPIVLLSPQGRQFDQAAAARLAAAPALALICGHYEGVDERVRLHLATEEISLGDFVLSGGEIAAMAVVDAVVRLLPGVIDPASLAEESYQAGRLEYPHFTRPAVFRDWRVPDILLSGHHGAIASWRHEQALRRTWERRPDLVRSAALSEADRALIALWQTQSATAPVAPSAAPDDPPVQTEGDAAIS